MLSPSITLENADKDDVDRIETLLEANGLPSQDVRAEPDCFFLCYADTECIGIGGLEIYGSNGLLRSIVILESHRGQGYGTAVCDAVENYARTSGTGTLYLLTTTAAAFFRQRGYEAIDREAVPSSIQQTTEFADLCPSSALCMRKHLPE